MSVNLSVVRSSQPICVMPLVNVLIFSDYLFWLSDVRLKIPLYVLASQPGEHMVKKHGFSESRMCDVTHYITEIKCPFMGENHGKPMDYKMCASTIFLRLCWKCYVHPLRNVTMLFGREVTVT